MKEIITKVFSESEFFWAHDEIKNRGGFILRCIQKRTPKGMFFELIYRV